MFTGSQPTSDAKTSSEGESRTSAPPTINLPKGGGAIRGIGEKFAANPVTGTGSMTVPIATGPGRSGFGPQLSLSYDSGAGNGPFGFGWSLSLPAITRKTDKGLPRYLDGQEQHPDSDVFILSGAEDLVPVLRKNGSGEFEIHDVSRTVGNETYRVRRYRPRIEGLFARIERWSRIGSPGDVHWRSISKDNILTLYGHDANSRIADPLDASRIFSWLICESRDDKGNGIRYLYKEEDGHYRLRPGQPDPFKQAHQLNRGNASDARRTAQRYLHRVLYGNVKPLLDAQGRRPHYLSDLPNSPTDTGADWLFEARFDYGELEKSDPTAQPEKSWFYRPDAFSSYRSGFEVRTCRRCERVLMLHHIPDQPASPGHAAQSGYKGVVRSTEFTYDDVLDPSLATQPIYSFLKQVVQTGWKQANGFTTRRSLPPVEFAYTEPIVQDTVEDVDAQSLENLPVGLDGAVYQWTDLHGEGIPGILTEQAGSWFYKRNWSPIPTKLRDDSEAIKAKFAPLETVALKPNLALGSGAQFLDLAGDGQPDLVVMDGPIAGFYEHDEAEGWEPFHPFPSRLNRDFRDPNLKFVDLDGDGHADVLITEDDALVWHPSLAEAGFGPAQRVAKSFDEEKGPRLVFDDGEESIYLADMSGDGLTDLVHIRNGAVDFYPSLGFGRFGAKVTMDNAPWFDHPDQFDRKRIRLADIDGSGSTDIIYLHRDGVRLYFNQSGNSWSAPRILNVFPRVDDLVSITPVDLLGNGTACLVWSSSLPGDAGRQMRYVNLMGEKKPHLLIKTINNLGAETRVDYAPSTKFYLQDKRDGKPWITRLPFPVHVVERVETYDHISRNHFVSRYAYHHGYFDGEEREFRGFGMVEQWDTERFAALGGGNVPADNIAAASHVPPVHTKTWFHTGVYDEIEEVSQHFAAEYYGAPEKNAPGYDALFDAFFQTLLPDTVIPPDLTLDEERQACRALKGSMLRQEVYADDADYPGATAAQIQRSRMPYTVTEQNFTIRPLQLRGENRHAVFFTHVREAVSYHFERNPADPRISHALTLEVDTFGNVLKSAAIGYGRRQSNPALPWEADREKQTTTILTYSENSFTNPVQEADAYRIPLAAEVSTFELTGYITSGSAGRFQSSDFVKPDLIEINRLAHDFDQEIQYEEKPGTGKQRRLIERSRTYFRPDDFGAAQNNPLALLPLRVLESMAMSGESYKLAFTPGLLTTVYRRPQTSLSAESLLPNPGAILAAGNDNSSRGGYVDLDNDGYWWIPSGRDFLSRQRTDTSVQERTFAAAHFFLPHRHRNPFDTDATPTESIVRYDEYDLLIEETLDPLGNRVTVGERDLDPVQPLVRRGQDYRVLQPALVMDPNRNRTAVKFDALGLVVGTAVMGKPEDNPQNGDSLTDFVPDLDEAAILAHLQNPVADPHAILRRASTRLVYDLSAYHRTKGQPAPVPATVYSMVRETHDSDLAAGQKTKVQHSFSYSDGFGREIQKKLQAERGPVPRRDAAGDIIVDANGRPAMTVNDVSPRWVGSGWTVFNNKGKPVRQYEPFFTDRHNHEFDVRIGVSPVLFYDPVERVVATLHPNHTWEKVVFDSWRQETWDVNDTVLVADPKTDTDVGEFFKRLPAVEYLPTWHALRTNATSAAAFAARYPNPTDRANETRAAAKTRVHAGTPTVAHADALGRTFLTISHNKFKYTDTPQTDPPVEEFYGTRVTFDIEGNQREVIDAKDRVVMRYDYDMLGDRIYQASMEAGERWMLNDVAGKPLYTWDSRDHRFRTGYDPLRRPTDSFLREGTGEELVIGRTIYGETQPSPETNNLRGRVIQRFDQAGVVTSDRFDFKGNLLENSRQLAKLVQLIPAYKTTVNWSAGVQREAETYFSRTRYDALNRPTQVISPHSDQPGTSVNVTQPIYNEANLLEQVNVWLNLNAVPAVLLDPATANLHAVTDIDYDAKGQRIRINHATRDGKLITTSYDYDPETFRLIHLYTRRGVDPVTEQGVTFTDDCDNPQPPPPTIAAPEDPPQGKSCGLQNLHYHYDPAGNVTFIRDDAQQTIYFKNSRVEPSADYAYDAIYRLIEATGREHLGQVGGTPTTHSYNDVPRIGLPHPNERNAMGNYLERYEYDGAGNILRLNHKALNGSWAREYAYEEPSLLELTRSSNRLSRTNINTSIEQYTHDPHGNMTRLPHLQVMQWDFSDQLQMTQRQAVNAADVDGAQHQGERTWYVYDSTGQRVRKVTELATGDLKDERIYLGGFEIYRKNDANPLVRETLHIMDDRKRIAMVEVRTQGVEPGVPAQLIRYQFGNHLGSVSLELDDDAQIVSYEEYTPYGSTSYQAVHSQTESPNRYRYTGKERDDESGLYYHGARYCAPWLGRWASSDPLGIKSSLNSYEYCHGSPSNIFDPDGKEGFWHNAWEVTKGVGAGAADFGAGIGKMVAHPLDTAAAISSKMKEEYYNEGGGAGGVISAINVVNPAYHAMVAAYETSQAVEQGNYKEAGRQGFNATIQTVSTVLVATGAVGVGGGVAGGGVSVGSKVINVGTKVLAGSEGVLAPITVTVPTVTVSGAVATSTATVTGGAMMMVAAGPGSPGSPPSPPKKSGGKAPVEQGKAGVEKAKEAAKARGAKVVGEEITVKTSKGKRRLDLLTEEPVQGGQPQLTNLEVKTGNSPYTKLQQAKDAEIATKGGVAVGKKAAAAGVEGQTIKVPAKMERY